MLEQKLCKSTCLHLTCTCLPSVVGCPGVFACGDAAGGVHPVPRCIESAMPLRVAVSLRAEC
eukprot:scaffold275294_cov18-Tisochrysis_lutea.AAC.1